MIIPSDKMLVAGYPYGFSANGQSQPTPVVLKRFVAAVNVPDRRRQYLLESIGGAGMSGGPVFVEIGTDVLLVGLYTGLVYPDYLSPAPQLTTALGTVADISFHLHGHLNFLRPSTFARADIHRLARGELSFIIRLPGQAACCRLAQTLEIAMNKNYLQLLQKRVGGTSVGASTARGMGPAGTIQAARKYLQGVNISRFVKSRP